MGYVHQGRYASEIEKGMQRKQLSPTELAARARISLPYLSQVLSGARNPAGPEITGRLARVLGIEPYKLHYLAGHVRVTEPRLRQLLQSAAELPGDDLDKLIAQVRRMVAQNRQES